MNLLRPELLVPAALLVVGATFAWWWNVARPTRRARRRVEEPAELSSPATSVAPDELTVGFMDVAGLDDAIAELREIQAYLSDPDRYHQVGADLPRGVLLYGPPGTGKTLLARALAREAGVPFHSVSAASFVEQYVGLGAARIRQLFEQAKRSVPCIVFIDELDAVGRRRSSGTAGDREFDHTLNQLLVELDGFGATPGVLLVGATNRPELLDAALTRPGRFDRRISVDLPDVAGREAILQHHASRRPVAANVDWSAVAGQTAGLSGAELANIVNEAALLAARRDRRLITSDEVNEAISRVLNGPRSSRLLTAGEKRLIAYHEAGHVLLSLLLRDGQPPARVSIVGRPGLLGRSAWAPGEEGEVLTKRQLMARLMVLLGGRAAEIHVFGEPSSRAEDDLESAADLARRMVERWAMTGRYELAGRRDGTGGVEVPETGSGKSVRGIIARAQQASLTILADHGHALRQVAEALLVQESLTIEEVATVAGIERFRPRSSTAAAGA